ncbi:MAG TPA: MOSC domain-containing protein [Afifellaceae bacterium]|nr:MOSC domain-containing protein [Afifellaceae bacterium]
MSPSIAALYRYPVKGFSPEALQSAEIPAGGTMPFDRAFAIENGPSDFNPAAPAHLPKIAFLMLMRNARLARYQTRFDDLTGLLTVRKDGAICVSGSLRADAGRTAIEAWIAKTFAGELRGPPKIVSAEGHSFSDRRAKVLHLVNLASIRDLEKRLGRSVDPLRFRPNIVIDGADAFAEFDWIGKRLRLPGIVLAGESRTERCAATNVDPATGTRDMQIPRTLMGLYGHADFGIYLAAETAGTLVAGDRLSFETPAASGLPF